MKKLNKNFKLYGYDTAYFGNNCINSDNLPEVNLDTQFYGDIRKIILGGFVAPVFLLSIAYYRIRRSSIKN